MRAFLCAARGTRRPTRRRSQSTSPGRCSLQSSCCRRCHPEHSSSRSHQVCVRVCVRGWCAVLGAPQGTDRRCAAAAARPGNGMSPCLTPDYLAAVRGINSLEELHNRLPPFDADSPMGRQPADKPGSMAPTYSVGAAPLLRGNCARLCCFQHANYARGAALNPTGLQGVAESHGAVDGSTRLATAAAGRLCVRHQPRMVQDRDGHFEG
jgi:hypothetical protein